MLDLCYLNSVNCVSQGGTLVQYEGKLRLLEMAQVPKDHVSVQLSKSVFALFVNKYDMAK